MWRSKRQETGDRRQELKTVRANAPLVPSDPRARSRFRGPSTCLLTTLALTLSGCVQEMDDQPRYEAYEASTLFPNGTSARPIPAGTVPRAGTWERDSLDFDPPYRTGRENGEPITSLPKRVTDRYELPELLARGRQRFGIFCTPCHGLTGDGDGMVARRGFPYPPTYHNDKYRAYSVGAIYSVITAGRGRMSPYESQIPADDRWAIAAYVKTLQFSRHAPADALPPADRAKLAEADR